MKFLKVLAVFLGTIIGVGIFGLPFVAAKAGFFTVFIYFLIMAGIAIAINIIYSEIVLNTKKLHRFPGYVQEYLGLRWKKFTFFVTAFGLIGALLAYLIVGGQFLFAYFGPLLGGNIVLYTLFFFTIGAYLVFRGVKSISSVELILLGIILAILVLFFVKAFSFIDIDNFKTFNPGYIFFPYGIILFSLWGTSIIPEIKEMLGGSKNSLRKVIITGIIMSVIIYLFFIYIVQGASVVVSDDAISGLEKTISSDIIRLGFLFGVITCFTSFITLALTLKKVLWYDFGFDKNISWFLTCFIPLGLFFMGLRKFIEVISFTGAIALGIEGIILVFLYREFLKKKLLRQMNPLFYLLSGVFVLGIILEVFLFYAKAI
ncbi:hypothetical protein KKC65_03190 [Patescibacteria group bacterium]|nr:hypothetical protein [Patescibacteria group bacterium]